MDTKLLNDNLRDPAPLYLGLSSNARKEKDTISRLRRFVNWLESTQKSWALPDLEGYRHHLIEQTGLSEMSARIHLATIRGRYYAVLGHDEFDYVLHNLLRRLLDENDIPNVVSYVKAHILNAIDPAKSRVMVEVQPADYLRLTAEQATQLVLTPGLQTLEGKRDTAVIALMLATGLRVAELSSLEIRDLRQETRLGPGLYVRGISQDKEGRYVPYGSMIWALDLVEHWMKNALIHEGAVFRAFTKYGSLRSSPLSVRAIETLIGNYKLIIDNKEVAVTPMVLRRTYASRLYEEGVSLLWIQACLGVGPTAVFDYIGNTSPKSTSSEVPNLYSLNSAAVAKGIKEGVLRTAKPTSDDDGTQNNQGAKE